MKEDEKSLAKVQKAALNIRAGIAGAIIAAKDDPHAHYAALVMEVSKYLDTWADLSGKSKQQTVDAFKQALDYGIKHVVTDDGNGGN